MDEDNTRNPPVQGPAEPTLWGLRRRELRIIAIVVSIKALFFIFAVQSYQVLQNQRVVGVRGWLEIWNRWDALNYQKLAQFGYSATGERLPLLVFYPLYPWTVRLVAFVTRDYLVSAFIVSTLASLVTAVLLLRLVELDYSEELAQRAVWFLFIFPTSYFLHIGYTESLFLMLVLSCLFAARKQRWLLAGLFGARVPHARERHCARAGAHGRGSKSILDHAPLAMAVVMDRCCRFRIRRLLVA